MTSALSQPGPAALLTQWAPQPLAVVAVVAAGAWYELSVRRLVRSGAQWPVGRSITFGTGLALLLWTTSGFLQAYGSSLYWSWTSQALTLLLAVPLVLLLGRPLQLARATAPGGGVDRFLRSGPVRVLSNPLVGPALIPVLSAVLFFGPVPGWAISVPPVGWLLHLVLVLAGGCVLLPLVGIDDDVSSLAVGLSLAIGMFELVLDAIPGLVLRLQTGAATSYFAHRSVHAWTPAALHDQQIAGGVLWAVAEAIDLPFLALVYRRWLRADERDAATVDAVLEAERIARSVIDDEPIGDETHGPADAPWWLTDPEMQHRLRRTE